MAPEVEQKHDFENSSVPVENPLVAIGACCALPGPSVPEITPTFTPTTANPLDGPEAGRPELQPTATAEGVEAVRKDIGESHAVDDSVGAALKTHEGESNDVLPDQAKQEGVSLEKMKRKVRRKPMAVRQSAKTTLLLNTVEACHELGGIHPRSLARLEKRGLIRSVGLFRYKLYAMEDLKALVEELRGWKPCKGASK